MGKIKAKFVLYFPYSSKCDVWKILHGGWQIYRQSKRCQKATTDCINNTSVNNGCDAGLPIRRSQVRCSPLLLFPWVRNFIPIAPVCCADSYTTVLLCRVLVDCMSYQGTAEKQYFYTDAVFPCN